MKTFISYAPARAWAVAAPGGGIQARPGQALCLGLPPFGPHFSFTHPDKFDLNPLTPELPQPAVPRPGAPRHNIICNSFSEIFKPIFRLYGNKSKICRPVFQLYGNL